MSKIIKDLSLPFDIEIGNHMAAEFGTPLYVYDQRGIIATAQAVNAAFNWSPGYKNYFAVKATPSPMILDVLRTQGMGFDCSSRTELEIMRQMGIPGEDIFFTSNNTTAEDFELAIELEATINIDDLTQVPVFIKVLGGRNLDRVALRYNPGKLKKGNEIIGKPEDAKYGMSIEQLLEAFALLKRAGIRTFGVHTMVASNELEAGYFAETAGILLDAVEEIEAAGTDIGFVNLGGGFGLNYKPGEAPFDLERAAKEIRQVFEDRGKQGLQMFTENGRYVTGPHGYLLTRARYIMNKYKVYVGVDASMHNLMRPGMYGAYHHITVLGKETVHNTREYDVSGSLCENNDKFAVDRPMPKIEIGDLLVIHDVGAHGHSMGFNYNGLLRSPEVIIRPKGKIELIRDGETVEQHLQNVKWPSRSTASSTPTSV